MTKVRWTEDACREASKNYKTRTEFKKGCVTAYDKSVKKGWIESYDWLAAPVSKAHTYDSVKSLVEKCSTLKEFYSKYPGAYEAALKNGWLKDFDELKRRNAYPLEYVIEVCNQYDSLSEFKSNNPDGLYNAYLKFYNNGDIKEGDIKWKSHTRMTWDYDSCYVEAKKYDSRWYFKNGNNSAYKRAMKEGWIDDYEWFKDLKNKNDYDKCKELASRFSSRSEFKKECPGVYDSSVRNGWINDFEFEESKYKWTKEMIIKACSLHKTKRDLAKNDVHSYDAYIRFKRKGLISDDELSWECPEREYTDPDDKIHSVYSYEFSDGSVYVGRTMDPTKRDLRHRHPHHAHHRDYNPTVLQHSIDAAIPIPEMKILESNLNEQESRRQEAFWCKEYSSKGYILLNKGSVGEFTGSVGGRRKWTKEAVREFAKNFSSPYEVRKANDRAGKLLKKYNLIEELFPNYTPRDKNGRYLS